jgi:hypothetical protein
VRATVSTRDYWQLRDLVPPRVPKAVSRGQAVRTPATRVGHQIDDRIHALDGDGARDSARDGQADRLTDAASSPADRGYVVDPRGHPMTEAWSRRGVLLSQRELALEIRALFLLFFKLFAERLSLLLQSFNLVRLAIREVARAFARLSPSRH